MRTYGRIQNVLTGEKTWVQVETDPNGYNDMVWLTTMAQVLKLNLNESPFFADWGIPATASVMSQLPPDYYVALTQRRFAEHFLALTLTREVDGLDESNRPVPYYLLNVITNTGAVLSGSVPV
jgi:hypothetical protein